MAKGNLYGEFDDDVQRPSIPQPSPEVKIVQVKSDTEIPFRWKVASQMMQGIINNHEYSSAISRALSSDGKSIDRRKFQEEVAIVSIGLADILIEKLVQTTDIKKE